MSTQDDRRRILDMLVAQKITAAEAEELLAALERPVVSAVAVSERPHYRYLRVKAVVSGVDTVDVRIPLQLIKSGLKLGSLLPAEIGGQVEAALKAKTGRQIDLGRIRPEDIDALLESLNELEINIAAQNTVIRVFCE